jgi:hypothetical protein
MQIECITYGLLDAYVVPESLTPIYRSTADHSEYPPLFHMPA